MPPDATLAEQRQPILTDDIRPTAPRWLKLRGARVTVDACSAVLADVLLGNGQIQSITAASQSSPLQSPPDPSIAEVDLTGFLILPGLINTHDHLEFSLFPKLGHGPYQNAAQWAQDIYRPESSPVREFLAVPKPVRLWWGGIRNLLCGVTTVCHHNEYYPDVFENGFPVRILKRYAWTHSLLFGKEPEAAFHASDQQAPFIIHLGEGTDGSSKEEIFELDRRGLLNERTVIVHGVALDDTAHELVIRRGAALIWCPGSNLFTLGATLHPRDIARNPRTALGSDSPLTAGDLLEQVAIARRLQVPAELIFDLVMTRAANVLKLQHGEGKLCAGSIADIVVVQDRGLSPAETLVQTVPEDVELVLASGTPQLLSSNMCSRLPRAFQSGLHEIVVDGSKRYIHAPVGRLIQEVQKAIGGTLRLMGKEVLG